MVDDRIDVFVKKEESGVRSAVVMTSLFPPHHFWKVEMHKKSCEPANDIICGWTYKLQDSHLTGTNDDPLIPRSQTLKCMRYE